MIILGDRYKFLKSELLQLQKSRDNIYHIKIAKRSSEKIIDELKEIKNKNIKLIVINSKVQIPKNVISYLTKQNLLGARLVTIEHFLENRFHKCFIDEDSTDFFEDINSFTIFQLFQKCIIDFIAFMVLLPIFLITLIFSLYKTKKESPGPIFYKQKRVGRFEKEFKCIKLRSMYLDAEKDGPKFAKEDDKRVFPWGRKLRNSKLDELGQLLNILKGDMHFVGPRPERRVWTKKFEKEIPFYSKRHLVKPGITGWAQIKYQYGGGTLGAYQKLMYDLYYIKHWSFLLDFKIVLNTAIFMLIRKRKIVLSDPEMFKPAEDIKSFLYSQAKGS